jgi:hypothetical protein
MLVLDEFPVDRSYALIERVVLQKTFRTRETVNCFSLCGDLAEIQDKLRASHRTTSD